jgi:hypothetical protein
MMMGVTVLATGAASAGPVCGAHVTVREVGRQANDDGTRTLKYRATVLAEPADGASCARVTFSVMRSYVKSDGSTTEGAIPVTLEVKKRNTTVDGEDVLATTRLVYWWADQVRCEPCSEASGAPAEAGPKPRAESREDKPQAAFRSEKAEKPEKAPSSSGRKKAAAALGAVALGAILLL